MASMIADYVIVGAGSAGSAIAYRLAEAGKSVLVIEYGGTDMGPLIQMPGALSFPMNMNRYNWGFASEPEPYLNGRVLATPRGKVVGGSSSINGMVYVRGHALDFEHWQDMGATGWGYGDVLPYFKRMEHWHSGGHGGDADMRGSDGPLHVTRGPRLNPLYSAFVEAGRQAGYPITDDYNGYQQEGFGPMEQTVWRGQRWSAANAYLKPARATGRCDVVHGLAERIAFTDGRATGVHLAGGRLVEARAEVIVAASSINSPKLLMLSGIGEAAQLQEHGIEVQADLPGVGKNLQDHLQARLVFKCNEPTLNDEVRSLVDQARIALKYALFRSGPMTMAASLATGFFKTGEHVATPDIQFHVQPWSADSPGEGVHPFSAFTMSVCQLRPESRGEIRLASSDAGVYPRIIPKYLSEETDCRTIVEGVNIARRIARNAPLTDKISEEFRPTKDLSLDDYAGTLDWARSNSVSIYHPTGTCKMGSGPGAVVDDRLRVHGIAGLRVADCSIMPEIVSGNTNAPAIMIGEKASDLILEDQRASV